MRARFGRAAQLEAVGQTKFSYGGRTELIDGSGSLISPEWTKTLDIYSGRFPGVEWSHEGSDLHGYLGAWWL